MARMLLAWELGAGLGHVRALGTIGRELRRRGHEVTLAIPEEWASHARATGLSVNAMPSPPPRGDTDIASHVEILRTLYWDDAARVVEAIRRWTPLLDATDLLVANHAPSALLAAHVRSVPRIAIGTGFACPPATDPLPAFRIWDPPSPQRLRNSERILLNAIQGALSTLGAPMVTRLAGALVPADTALWVHAELDPYGPRADVVSAGALSESQDEASFAPPDADAPTRVFAYLKWSHPATAPLLAALAARRDVASAAFVAGISATEATRWSDSPNVRLSTQPFALGEALAWSQLAICHAGASTTGAALAAGRALLLLPEVPEQFLTALAVQRLGAGHWWVPPQQRGDAAHWPSLLDAWLADTRMREGAQAFSARAGGFQPEHTLQRICAAIEAAN